MFMKTEQDLSHIDTTWILQVLYGKYACDISRPIKRRHLYRRWDIFRYRHAIKKDWCGIFSEFMFQISRSMLSKVVALFKSRLPVFIVIVMNGRIKHELFSFLIYEPIMFIHVTHMLGLFNCTRIRTHSFAEHYRGSTRPRTPTAVQTQ